MQNSKLLFVELDGGSWEIMSPLIRKGKLPNIKGLMDRGVSSDLSSDSPLISPKLWTSIFTGKSAKKHGIYFFGNNSRMVKCKRIWDIFNEQGLKVGVFGSLITWPPHRVNGFMIPAVFALGTETYPAEWSFFQEIALGERGALHKSSKMPLRSLFYYVYQLKTHGVSIRTFWHAAKYMAYEKIRRTDIEARYWKKAILHLRISTDLFGNLLSSYNPDFSTFHIHLCDGVCHRYMEYFKPEQFDGVDPRKARKYKDIIPISYIEADRAIGQLLSLIEKNTVVIIASDHGFQPLTKWKNDCERIRPYPLRIDAFKKMLGIENVIPARFGLEVFLYFHDPTTPLKYEIASVIESITLKETSDKVFDVRLFEKYIVVKVSDPILKKDLKENTLVNIPNVGIHKFSDLFHRKGSGISGIHAPKGILIMTGPNIKAGGQLQNPCIYDLTPTMLASMGYPVAKDMEGRVLTEALTDGFLDENPVQYIDSYEDSTIREQELEEIDYKKMEERLKSLGYL